MKYWDLQVNGAFGIDFNDDALTADGFELACQKLRESGTEGFLPTIITESIETMCRRIKKIISILDSKPLCNSLVKGLHIEGPFLSDRAGFYGTHPPQHILQASEWAMMRLLDAGQGRIRMVTLAPEQDIDCVVIGRLREENVMVFAGHTDASYSMLERAIGAGLVGFTHLGNGCMHQVDRHDNIMHRALALRDRLYFTLIADGVHLPSWLLTSWIGIIGTERCIIISDAISAAGMPPGEYSIGNQRILVDPSRRTLHRDHGYLAGSASTMQDMDHFLTDVVAMSAGDRKKVLLDNAVTLLGNFLPHTQGVEPDKME